MSVDLFAQAPRDAEASHQRFLAASESIKWLGHLDVDGVLVTEPCAMVGLRAQRVPHAVEISKAHFANGGDLVVNWRWALEWDRANPLASFIAVDLAYPLVPGPVVTLAFHAWRDRRWLTTVYEAGKMAWTLDDPDDFDVDAALRAVACDVDTEQVGQLLRRSEKETRDVAAAVRGHGPQRAVRNVRGRAVGQRRSARITQPRKPRKRGKR